MSAAAYDHTGAAAIYATSNQLSWAQALLVPGLQAAANILILERQKSYYDDISNEQKATIDLAVANYLACIDGLLPMFEDAYPDVPEAAEYVPVNPCQEQGDTIECNIGHIARANDWAYCINRLHEQNDLTRAVAFDPRWLVNMDLSSMTIQDLLRGKFPVSDLMEVMTDTAEQSCLTGRIGGCRHLTSRNLGISRLRMQHTGREELRKNAKMFEDISPHRRQRGIEEMMQTPQQRIALALTQAQLIQNSLQNVNNQNAQKPPHRLAELQMRLEKCINKLQHEASKASLVNSYVPNYAAILQPQIRALAGAAGMAIGGAFGGASTTQSSYNSPSVGGNYQDLMGANPFDSYK